MEKEIEQLIKDGRLEEAFALFEKDFAKPLAPEERGKVYTELLSAYMEATNNINKEEEENIRKATEIFKEISSKEDELKRQDLISDL